MSMTKKEKREAKSEALVKLREWIKAGEKVYTTVTHVARSGMQRSIRVFIMRDNEPFEITGYTAHALDYPRDDKNGGVKVGGCGMDMGFHIVYNLGRTLFPDGGSLAKTNTTRRSQAERAGEKIERDGGYLLKQVWL